MRLILLLITTLSTILADGFVAEVSCSAESLTVILNKSDPEVAAWVTDQAAQPVLYVYDHKVRRECGISLKNENGEVNYNLSIPYGNFCDVQLTDIEPNYRTAETTVVLEDNNDQSHYKNPRINHVFCLYTRKVQTIRFSDVAAGEKVVASTGGKPMPKVEMLFRAQDGESLRTAKFGDMIEFFVALSPDQAYKGISPKECMFSDREDMYSPEAKHLTFVQNGCPVTGIAEIISPLANVNGEVYFTKFKTFRFGNSSTVFAHCTVQVCLNSSDKECSQDCYKKVNSNLTASRLHFRHRRSVPLATSSPSESVSEISLQSKLTVLDGDENQEIATRSLEQCLVSANASPHLYLLVGILGSGFLLSALLVIGMCFKLRKGKQESFEVYGAYATSMVPSAFRY